jgi:glycosyltransferase involved in cell wall biosynthesis
VQRIVKYAKYLPEFGWEPIILTVEHPTSPANDNSLLNFIPNETKIFKTSTFEPFNFYRLITGRKKDETLPKDIIVKKPNEKISEKISRLIRANLFVPDARVGWIPFLVKEGMRIIRSENIGILFSTSPPHSVQLGARILAKKSGLPWIADLRDPWIEAYWESEIQRITFIHRLNENFEKKVLRSADMISTVSEGFVNLFSKKVSNKYEVFYHGFEFINTETATSKSFKIIYLGNMSKYQSPLPLFKALKKFPAHIKKNIDILIVGRVYTGFEKLRNEFDDLEINIQDYMPYNAAMKFSKQASLLLLINPTPVYGSALIPVKIYDYIALRKPIIAIGTKGGRLEQVFIETKCGKIFENTDQIDIYKFLKSEYTYWEKWGNRLLKDDKILDKYRVENNVRRLAELFESISSIKENVIAKSQ